MQRQDKLFAIIQIYLGSYGDLIKNKEHVDPQLLEFLAAEIQSAGKELTAPEIKEAKETKSTNPDSLI